MTVCEARWSSGDAAHEHRCEETAPHDVHECVLCYVRADAGMVVDPSLFAAAQARAGLAEDAQRVDRVATDLARAAVLGRLELIDYGLEERHAACLKLEQIASDLLAMSAGARRLMMEGGRL